MNSANVKICALITVFGLILTFPSCNKTKDPGPAIAKFTIKQATYAEDHGAVNVEVTLSAKQAADVTLNYTWTSGVLSYLDGDFSIGTTTPITIPAGQTVGHIQLNIIDDTQIDLTDTITVTLSGTSTNAKLSTVATDLSFVLNITNNDFDPANTLQADLTWSTGTGLSINKANLDLFLQDSVPHSGTTINGIGKTYPGHSSIATSGFETVLVASDVTDQEYFFAVAYPRGSGVADFILNLNGFGHVNSFGTGSFTAADAGSNIAYFFGPFIKKGSTFAFGRAGALTPKYGKVFSYKVDNFVKPH